MEWTFSFLTDILISLGLVMLGVIVILLPRGRKEGS